MRLRCPICDSGQLLRDWLHFVPACPVCGLPMDRDEPGYEVGTVWFNLVAAEVVVVVACGAIFLMRWPDVPWSLLEWLGPIMAIVAPFVFYPFAKMLFLAVDLTFQPIKR
ncbi:MAG TPA: DUF983 domain-containing protein [Gemmatimonadales bacterium]